MVSATQQSSRIRKRKSTTNGKANKRQRRAEGTPAFAVHPEGYDAKAADAKKPETKRAPERRKVAKAPKKAAKPPAKS
jgi:hypothetical protein